MDFFDVSPGIDGRESMLDKSASATEFVGKSAAFVGLGFFDGGEVSGNEMRCLVSTGLHR